MNPGRRDRKDISSRSRFPSQKQGVSLHLAPTPTAAGPLLSPVLPSVPLSSDCCQRSLIGLQTCLSLPCPCQRALARTTHLTFSEVLQDHSQDHIQTPFGDWGLCRARLQRACPAPQLIKIASIYGSPQTPGVVQHTHCSVPPQRKHAPRQEEMQTRTFIHFEIVC